MNENKQTNTNLFVQLFCLMKKDEINNFYPVDSDRFQNVRKSFVLACITAQFRNKLMYLITLFQH